MATKMGNYSRPDISTFEIREEDRSNSRSESNSGIFEKKYSMKRENSKKGHKSYIEDLREKLNLKSRLNGANSSKALIRNKKTKKSNLKKNMSYNNAISNVSISNFHPNKA